MDEPTEIDERVESAREETFRASLEFDDEPLDEEDLAALAEPWDPATAVSLDEHFERRAAHAT